MGRFEDFDLDLKKSEGSGVVTTGISETLVSIVTGSVLTGCSENCLTVKCSDDCPMPTEDRPAASCHKNVVGKVQVRC